MRSDLVDLLPKREPLTKNELDEWARGPEGQAWEQQLQLAARRLEEQLSHIKFYAERANKDPLYWRNLASSAPFA